ncbi:hypothetical protein A0J48_018655 [Sphaerospermopsis aphanizomenoides BCCUSP55]|uniref:hypothetical protein n=1 Tax=Sphaerospermopsis aphanizomenoides TaxID=459663 RepID=UPI001902DF32|nr:hypothetical protein [Sphaerospermopsis aphanizomenoides]MBK1989530.1 hypothetical protein [Sphaerospermopsis aphanizomenoides BCCUSP55]
MLKIRTFVIALLLTPFISFTWQLTNQAQTNSPSKGTAGSASGGGTTGSGGTVISSPSKGTAGSGSGGGNTGSNNNPVSSPSKGVAGSASGATSNVIVKKAADGSISIELSPPAVRALNVVVNRIISSGNAGIFLPTNTNNLRASLISNGLSPQLAKELTGAASQIIQFSRSSSTSSLPALESSQARLVASIKAAKAGLTITETNEAVTVNADKLNEAINIYNKIVLESEPVTLQKLARNSDFVKIGKALTTLRAAIR